MEPLWDYDASIGALADPGAARDHFDGALPYAPPALCAEMARLVYCDDHAYVTAALGRAGFREPVWFSRDGTDAFLAEAGEVAVLAFRGTESPRIQRLFAGAQMPDLSSLAEGDWMRNLSDMIAAATPQLRTFLDRAGESVRDVMTDLDALPEDWEHGGKVHRGFAGALRRVWAEIVPDLERIRTPVLYTGHSLGAALAVLAAGLRPPEAAYTFGAPRVGDRDFVASLGASLGGTAIHRYVNCCDLICRLPPKLYEPAGRLHYIDTAGHMDGNDESDDIRLEARIAHFRRYAGQWDKAWFRDLIDHAPVNYLTAVLRNT